MTNTLFKFNRFKRFILYGLAGSIGVLSDILVFSILSLFFSTYYYFAYNSISYLFGTCVSFLFNSRLTFSSKYSRLSFSRFLFVAFIGICLSSLIIYLLVSNGLSSLASKLIATALVVLFQFLSNTLFSVVPNSRSK